MILICSEIKEVKVEGIKTYVYRLVLDTQRPENSSYKAAILEYMSVNRFPNIEAGDSFLIKKVKK